MDSQIPVNIFQDFNPMANVVLKIQSLISHGTEE